MQTKYAALESKCKMLLSQPNHAVSGATLALSDLGSRLNDLVEQLIASYNISEQELEVRENDQILSNFYCRGKKRFHLKRKCQGSKIASYVVGVRLRCYLFFCLFTIAHEKRGRSTNYYSLFIYSFHDSYFV